MLIHRTDFDLIPPAKPSEESAHVVIGRRPNDQRPQEHGHPAQTPHEEESDEAETQQVSTTLYDPEGHLEEREAPGAAPHQIDFTA